MRPLPAPFPLLCLCADAVVACLTLLAASRLAARRARKATVVQRFCNEGRPNPVPMPPRCWPKPDAMVFPNRSQPAVNRNGSTTDPDGNTTGLQPNVTGVQQQCRQPEAKISKRGEIQGIPSLTSVARIGKSPGRQ